MSLGGASPGGGWVCMNLFANGGVELLLDQVVQGGVRVKIAVDEVSSTVAGGQVVGCVHGLASPAGHQR